MISPVQGLSFSANEQPIHIWSANHKPHGIIPSKLIERATEYYTRKGDFHIVDDYAKHQNRFKAIRDTRVEKHNQHRGLLADGQIVRVYSARNTERLRFKLIRDDHRKSKDRSVNEAYEGARATYLLLKEEYKIKSLDGKSFPLNNTVHYGRNYANAFWDGDEMVFGDGDGKIFRRFTIAIDVTGHEIAHGVTQEQCGKAISWNGKPMGVAYEGEAGGINEALSDILGIQVKQKAKNQTATESDWLIGEGLIKGAKGKTYALRSMSNPGTGFVDHPRLGSDSQIRNYPDYLMAAESESVDPHDSSGIVNKAFYEAATKLGGFTWEKTGQIFFKTLPYLRFDETFSGMAEKTVLTAQKLFGKGSPEEDAIRTGWKTVQVQL